MIASLQRTINSSVNCNGIGLHSGVDVKMTLSPAPVDTGIVFIRSDIGAKKGTIKANYKNVVDANLGTTIANEFGAKVATIEHLMAAIWGCEIDNLIIEINAAEVPIMDGSSEPFIFLIECAGVVSQDRPRKIFEILKKVSVTDRDKFVSIEPAKEFSVDLKIDFNHSQIKKQNFDFHSNHISFKNDLSRARTFGFEHEIEALHKMGLAKGGSLDNAIVVGKDGIVNKNGLRYEDEFVKHKTLDFIGDIYLAGGHILGRFTAFKSGHAINNKMLHALFSDESAWRLI
jgi:UDP-3-O-[3-hydroxymyristoyl] N-acetylglucosamine deacetylase